MRRQEHYELDECFWLENAIMSTGPHRFREKDAARLIRSAVKAGLKVRGVRLEGADVVLVTEDNAAAADCNVDELTADDELTRWKQTKNAR